MKYFLDTEFIESPGSIQLISIGIVAEDERTFYAENTSFDEREADDWVIENVLSKLRWWDRVKQFVKEKNGNFEICGTLTTIKQCLLEFFGDDDNLVFYGYYADYDWVIFCWIFGKMIDLPAGWPKYCRDLKQMLDESGKDKIAAPEEEHNSLIDARWDKSLYEHLKK